MNSIKNGTARLNGWWDVRTYDMKYSIRRATEKIEEEFENMSDITESDQGDFTYTEVVFEDSDSEDIVDDIDDE